MKNLKFLTGLFMAASLLGVLTGCSSVQVQDYKDESPKLILENYLNGPLEAQGFFQDRSGMIVKRFTVQMKATWKDQIGTLEENFEYSDGTKSRRVWTIKKESDGKYTGTASDVIGSAEGESAGNALRWKYTLDLPVGKSSYHVQLDDWMYLMDDRIMINKSKMSKLGIYLGELTIVFTKK